VSEVTNIAGYRFVDLPDRDDLLEPFTNLCHELELRGTVLLSLNGINFFLAATQDKIDTYIEFIERDKRFKEIPLKISYTDYQPFNRMHVKRKKEIISLGLDHIRPIENTGERIMPKDFKEMLDAGKDVVVLDTRNDYETRVGAFANAVELGITNFRAFPEAVDQLPADMKDKTVVMYCTGGIRCEKASVVLMDAGFKDVRQLEGGILGYFEEVGGEHWNGDCFVFDQRVAVNSELQETEVEMCFRCWQSLSQEEQASELYEIGVSCPYCVEP
jgi:UPF0176 protein